MFGKRGDQMERVEKDLWESNKFLRLCKHIVYVLFAVLVLYMFLASMVSTCVMVYTDEDRKSVV